MSSMDGYFPGDLYAYANVVLPAKLLAPLTRFIKPKYGNYPFYDTGNRFGNQLGSIDLSIVINTSLGRFDLIRQSGYDADPLKINFLSWDGNYVLVYKAKEEQILNKLSFEILNTENQALKISKLAHWFGLTYGPPQAQGYFNHGQYFEGWSYNGKGMGTAAIIPNSELREPQKNYDLFTADNKISSFSFSVAGKYEVYDFAVKLGHITSFGTTSMARNVDNTQFTSQLTLSKPLKRHNIRAKVELGCDVGKLYGNQIGTNLIFTKSW